MKLLILKISNYKLRSAFIRRKIDGGMENYTSQQKYLAMFLQIYVTAVNFKKRVFSRVSLKTEREKLS